VFEPQPSLIATAKLTPGLLTRPEEVTLVKPYDLNGVRVPTEPVVSTPKIGGA
jgi:hypothetical protein